MVTIVEPGTKIDSAYYCEGVLSQMIPEMSALSDGAFTFQQDGARSHTSAFSLNYFEENLPDNAELLKPDFWPPNSPDLNPKDYHNLCNMVNARSVCVLRQDSRS